MKPNLRESFKHLTPAERHRLFIKSMLGDRKADATACVPEDPGEYLSFLYCSLVLSLFAGQALYLACHSEAHASQLVIRDMLPLCGKSPTELGLTAEANEASRQFFCWVRAIKRIEDETGGPLLDLISVLGASVEEEWRDANFYENMELDYSCQYELLRKQWNELVETADRNKKRVIPETAAPVATEAKPGVDTPPQNS